MVQIILIRPGATDYDQQRRIQGNLDVPLNEEGIAEVQRMIEDLRALNMEVVYGGCCEPAMQTAQAIAGGLGIKFRKVDKMQNLNYGLWQGTPVEEVRLKHPKVYRQWQEQPELVCPPEGEMLSQAAQRVEQAVTRLLKRHKEGVIGLVVPEPLASLVRRFVTHAELGDLWKAIGDHGRWEVLPIEPETLVPSG
jgi:broad specificity phosphatase PhoE